MALTIKSPLDFAATELPGDEVDEAAMQAYLSLQSETEHVCAALLADIESDEDAPALVTGDLRTYILPRPRNEAATTVVNVWLRVVRFVGDGLGGNSFVEVNGVEIEVDSDDLYGPIVIDFNDADDFSDLTVEVTTGGLAIPEIWAEPDRSDVAMLAGEQPNGITAIDDAVLADGYPLSVHRQADAAAMATAIHRQQYRTAWAAAAWNEGHPLDYYSRPLSTRIEVPCSRQRTCTLTVMARWGADLGEVSLTIGGITKVIAGVAASTWYTQTWTIDTAPPGTSRPYGIDVVADATAWPDASLMSLCAFWSEVSP